MKPTNAERDAHDALAAYTLAHGDLAFIHQHVVDAFAAQYATTETKPISLVFALIGLYLHVERGLSGRQVQRAHIMLAKRSRHWPTFALPEHRGTVTVVDVMSAAEGAERDRAIEAWCVSVWNAYRDVAPAVVVLAREHGLHAWTPG